MNYSVISEYNVKEGTTIYALRQLSSADRDGLHGTEAFVAKADGSRNPDLSRYDWKPIRCLPDNVDVNLVGHFTSGVNQNDYMFFKEVS